MKTFVPPAFAKLAAKERLTDDDLRSALAHAERGLVDGHLGAFLIKQRVPRRGQGRSGGFRTVVAYQRGKIAVFLHLFAKNTKANLNEAEAEAYLAYARELMTTRGWRRIEDEQRHENLSK